MKISDYKNLIQILPVSEQAFTVSKKNLKWELASEKFKWVKDFNDVSLNTGKYTINRQMILDAPLSQEKILQILYWGYPQGMQGNVNHIAILNDASKLVRKIEKVRDKPLRSDIEISDFIEEFTLSKGLGLSSASKLWYFCGVSFGGYDTLILDQRLIDVFSAGVFDEYNDFKGIRYENAKKFYQQYLKRTAEIAEELNTKPDHIEYFLFQFGKNLLQVIQ